MYSICLSMHFIQTPMSYYRKTSNIIHTLVGNKIVDNSYVVGAFQLHLHSRLNTWLQWTEQKQLQDEIRNIYV